MLLTTLTHTCTSASAKVTNYLTLPHPLLIIKFNLLSQYAVSTYVLKGKFYDNSAEGGISGAAKNDDTGKWLWAESEKLTGIKLIV